MTTLSSSSTSDNRMPDKIIPLPEPKVKADEDPMGDSYISFASILSSIGLFTRNRTFCWLGILLCLMSLGQRKAKGYSWSTFITGLVLGLVGVSVTILQELGPAKGTTGSDSSSTA